MFVDYKKVHNYLSGKTGYPGGLLALLNQGLKKFTLPVIGEEGRGSFITQHTGFFEDKISFGLFARNVSNPHTNELTGVKRVLKFILGKSRLEVGTNRVVYPGAGDKDRQLSFELDHEHITKLAVLFDGGLSEVEYATVNDISITIKQTSEGLSISTRGGELSFNLLLKSESIFELRMAILKYCLLLHPEVPPEATLDQLVKSFSVQTDISAQKGLSRRESDTTGANSLQYVNDIHTLKQAFASQGAGPATPKTKSCLWAIGHNGWIRGQNGLDIIQVLQNHAGEDYCRMLVDSANSGDFKVMDDLYSRVFS